MQTMLARNQLPAVDLWSLDVEGFEMPIIKSFPWSEIAVGAVLVEDLWIPSREAAHYMTTRNGFVMFAQLEVDSIYVNRQLSARAPLVGNRKPWPRLADIATEAGSSVTERWEHARKYREQHRYKELNGGGGR